MLVSGVVAGLVAGVAFGGDWRRLATFTLRWWPVLVFASALRLWTYFLPLSDLAVYIAGLGLIGLVAAVNWRLPGSAMIAIGTLMNVLVVLFNAGMPYDLATVLAVGAPVPHDGLHIQLSPDSRVPFLADIIPFGVGHSVYSLGDFLIAFGGFLIPFVWLQPKADPSSHDVRSANFAFFWLAQVVSRFGDPITLVALTYVAYRTTQSALMTAVAVGVASVPNALFGFFGGAIADAFGARRSMFWCDVMRSLVVGAIPVFLFFDTPLVVIFALAFIAAIGGAVFNPARSALVPALLRREHLARGNSLVYASDRAVEIGGALAGGVLVAAIGEGAFYVDALTFAFSAVLLARVAINEDVRAVTWARVWGDARAGLQFLRRTSVLWTNTVFSLSAQFANPVVNTLTPVLLIRRFAGNDALAGAVLFSGSEAAIALGAVIGSAVLPRQLERVPKGRSLVVGYALAGIVIVLIAFAPSYTIAVPLFGILGFTNVLFFVPTVTLLQERTPQEMVASVFGARIAITNLSWLPIIFLGGIVGDAIGVELFMGVAGLVTLGTAIVGAFIPAVRDVP